MPAGPEYVLVDAREPHLFVVRRQLRGAPGAPPTPQALYYVLEGSVYQAPPLGAVLSSRVVREKREQERGWGRDEKKAHVSQATPTLSPHPTPHTLQDRCLWSMRTAFNRVQADLDPLARDAAGNDDDAAAVGPPPHRYTDAERERARTGDRIVSTVLAGLGRGGGGVGGVSGLGSGVVSGSGAPSASAAAAASSGA